MIIFMRRIPSDTNKFEIKSFIEPALNGGLFTKKGYINTIKILQITDSTRNTHEYHGLVRVEPDSAGARAIKQLNKQPINGKMIIVREYFHRCWQNDPRIRKNHSDIEFADRRKGDRRRKTLEVAEMPFEP